ncbi:MAG TPA: hypothetical protein DCP90_04600 [Clostridiales bacterium]|nr:MAG: hypothetical protein A2Y22_06665 [Clostridiales bacterium GWD2_32_59]HAN09876.1 hypothetical protein [Clostridiales bacterium]
MLYELNRFYEFYQSNILLKILLIVVLFFIIYAVKSYISDALIHILKKIFLRNNVDSFNNSAVNMLRPPLRLLITTLLMYIVIINVLYIDTSVIVFLNKVLQSIITISIFWALYRLDSFFIHLLYKGYIKISEDENDLLVPFLKNIYKVLIALFGIIMSVEQWYDIGVIIAGLGIGGIAFALAGKDAASNLFGSIMIILEKTFKIGDYIQTKHGEGVVEDIGFRSTKLRTSENNLLIIPNSMMGSEEIVNISRKSNTKTKFIIELASKILYNTIEKVISELKQILITNESIEKDTIIVTLIEASQLNSKVLVSYYINSTVSNEVIAVQENVNIQIKKMLEKIENTNL